jgi:hypothetical protein
LLFFKSTFQGNFSHQITSQKFPLKKLEIANGA